MNRTKVVFLCSGNNKFGVAPFIKSQAEGLEAEGVKVDFFTVKGGGIWSYIKASIKFRSFIKGKNYQLIHAHYGFCGWTAFLSFSGLPIVISLMGSDVYGTFHEASIENKTKKNFSDFLSIYSTQILLRFVSFIIVKSPNLFSYIPKKHHGKCEIVPNGVDFECFKPMDRVEARKELGLPLQNKIILFLGDPKIKRKNFPMALQAIELVKNTYPDIQLISPYPVPHAFIPKYMNAANVLVLPSFEEGSPNVVKESLACNVPVVCTNVGDVEDHLSKLKNSFIVNFSPEELGRMIIATIELEDKNKEDSRSIISYLDRRLISKKIIQIYSQVLA